MKRTINSFSNVKLSTVLCMIRNGLTVKQSKDLDGLPITRIETISNGEIDSNRVGYGGIKEHAHSQWLLKPGDILFSHINSEEHLGKVALYEGEPRQLIHGMNLLNLRANESFILPKYLLRVLRSDLFRLQLRRVINRSVNQASVSITALNELEIPLPPLAEQKRIADILDKADAIRRKRLETIQHVSHLIESGFAHFFGDVLLNQHGFPTSSLEDLVGQIIDCPHSTPTYADCKTEYHCVRSSDIQDGVIDFNQTRYVSDATYFERIERHRPAPGEVVFTREGGRLGNAAQIPPNAQVCLGQRMMLFAAKPNGSTNEFIWALLNSAGVQHQIRKLTAGAAAPRINISDIRQFRVMMPPYHLQQEFSDFVQKMRKQSIKVTQSKAETDHLFNSLVQRTFREVL